MAFGIILFKEAYLFMCSIYVYVGVYVSLFLWSMSAGIFSDSVENARLQSKLVFVSAKNYHSKISRTFCTHPDNVGVSHKSTWFLWILKEEIFPSLHPEPRTEWTSFLILFPYFPYKDFTFLVYFFLEGFGHSGSPSLPQA